MHRLMKKAKGVKGAVVVKAKGRNESSSTVDVGDLIQQGVQCQAQGNDIQALKIFSKAVKRDPQSLRAYLERSLVYVQRGYYERALLDVNRLLELSPSEAQFYTHRGLIKGFLGLESEALADHQSALTIKPTSEVYNNRGLAQRDPKKALADFTKAIELNPKNTGAYQNRALLYMALKQYENALSDFNCLVGMKFREAFMLVQCGVVYQNLDRHKEALSMFDRAIALDPNCSEAYNNKGFSLHKLGDVDGALESFTKAIALDPNNSNAYYNRGVVLKSLGRYQEAPREFARALSLKSQELPDLPKSSKEKMVQQVEYLAGCAHVIQSFACPVIQVSMKTVMVVGKLASLSVDPTGSVGKSLTSSFGMVGGVFKIGTALADRAVLVLENKEQCKSLADKVLRLCDSIMGLNLANNIDHYRLTLNKFEEILKQAQALVERFSEKSYAKQVLLGGSYEKQFNDISKQLDGIMTELNLGVSVQGLFNAEEAQRAAKLDLMALKDNMQEIINSNMERLNQNMLLEKQEQSKIFKQQQDSMLLQFQRILGEKPQPVVEQEFAGLLMIPFHTLDIEEKIGQGKLGTIYKGRYNGEVVAIKEITGIRGDEARRQFLREAKIMSHLRSCHFALFYGICCEEDRQYLVMEYMSKGPLDEYLAKNKNLGLVERHQLIRDVVSGLRYLHTCQVYHRDLTSANVLINQYGMAKISDFGMAKVSQEVAKTIGKNVQVQASSYKIYAPERFGLKSVPSAAWDIYSLGVLIWEILTGQMAYAGISDQELGALVISGERESIPSYIPEFYQELIKLCWHKSPEKRPTIGEIDESLNVFGVPDIELLFQEGLLQEKTHQNYEKAVECYETAAAYGSYRARTNLAGLYFDGCGVAKDEQKAHDLFLQSAEDGHPRAMVNLAVLYEDGFAGQKPDLKQARYWLEKAEKLGDTFAAEKLAQMKPVLAAVPVGRGSPSLFNNRPSVQSPQSPVGSAPSLRGRGAPVPRGGARGFGPNV